MLKTGKKNIRQLSLNELEAYFETLGEKKFRSKQVYEMAVVETRSLSEVMTNPQQRPENQTVRQIFHFQL